jgi:predicted phage terminase large subunit-like protein
MSKKPSPLVPIPLQLHPAQSRFCKSRALYRGFVGGRGAGKTYIGALDLMRRSENHRTYLVASPTGVLLNDTTFPSFQAIARQIGFWPGPDGIRLNPYPTVILTNGATVRFRSAEDPERMRGPNLSGVWMDEASLMDEDAYSICIASLREGGEQGWLSATFTPKGQSNWTWPVFGRTIDGRPATPNTELIRASTAENPFLATGFDQTLRDQYRDGSRIARQELDAEFLAESLTMFARHWWQFLPVAPELARRVRAWDLAATEPKPGREPDYTVGALVGVTKDKQTVICGLVRDRLSPLATERLILGTAAMDGRAVGVVLEQEPGAAAKIYCADLARKLAGYVVTVRQADGNKAERASPLSSMVEAGAVSLVRGRWNDEFLDEAEQFPGGKHDDQVDAVSLAFNHLMEPVAGYFTVATVRY